MLELKNIGEILWYYGLIRNRYANTLLISCAILILFVLLQTCHLLRIARATTLQRLENGYDVPNPIEINTKRYWHDYTTFQIIRWRLTGVNTWKVLYALSHYCYRATVVIPVHTDISWDLRNCVYSRYNWSIRSIGGTWLKQNWTIWVKNEWRESKKIVLFNIIFKNGKF